MVLGLTFQVRPGPGECDLGLGDVVGSLFLSEMEGPNDLHPRTLARCMPHNQCLPRCGSGGRPAPQLPIHGGACRHALTHLRPAVRLSSGPPRRRCRLPRRGCGAPRERYVKHSRLLMATVPVRRPGLTTGIRAHGLPTTTDRGSFAGRVRRRAPRWRRRSTCVRLVAETAHVRQARWPCVRSTGRGQPTQQRRHSRGRFALPRGRHSAPIIPITGGLEGARWRARRRWGSGGAAPVALSGVGGGAGVPVLLSPVPGCPHSLPILRPDVDEHQPPGSLG